MKLLLVVGRLRERDPLRGSVAALAEDLRQSGVETEVFSPLKTEDLLCSGCGACKGAGMCVADPRGKEFLKAAAGCDGFLIAAPVGLLGLGIDLRNLLMRAAELTARSKNDPFAGKPAALIVGRLSRKAAKELRELTQALGLDLCELTALLPALDKKEKKK